MKGMDNPRKKTAKGAVFSDNVFVGVLMMSASCSPLYVAKCLNFLKITEEKEQYMQELALNIN